MSKKDRTLATKIVDKFATHEVATVDDTTKDFTIDPETEEPIFEKTSHHVYRFVELGYNLVGADESQRKAKAQVVDVIAKDLEDGNISLADDWIEQNLKD